MTSIEWVKNELSYTDDHLTTSDRIMLNRILKDLERLELLEIENKVLQEELDNKNKKLGLLTNKNYQLEKENEELKEQLKLSNESQETVINTMNLVSQENEKLKKFIEFLKEETELRIAVVQGQYLIQQGAGNFKGIYVSKEKGDFLKEVLDNEICK